MASYGGIQTAYRWHLEPWNLLRSLKGTIQQGLVETLLSNLTEPSHRNWRCEGSWREEDSGVKGASRSRIESVTMRSSSLNLIKTILMNFRRSRVKEKRKVKNSGMNSTLQEVEEKEKERHKVGCSYKMKMGQSKSLGCFFPVLFWEWRRHLCLFLNCSGSFSGVCIYGPVKSTCQR